MGQDSEEAAEFVVTVRNEHVKMKEWFTTSESSGVKALKEKFGPYPMLWKEVLNWPGWKDARREYLKQEQQKESSSSNAPAAASNGDGNTSATTPSVPRKRKSRWGSATTSSNNINNSAIPPTSALDSNKRLAPSPGAPRVVLPTVSAANLTPQQQQEMREMQAKLRLANERLDNLEREAARIDALPRGHRERSPSPPPIYGTDGKRKNTRAVRWRERYTAERQDLLEGIMRLSSKGSAMGGLPPGASSLLVRKRVKKIRIPVEEHPTYNFIGLIIGPRGKTQKDLESKTGCKIAIRGRGSVKEGARGRRDGKLMDGDNEPLHVVISGDNQRAVDAASDMVEQMLVVIDDEKNVHKQQQLRELALLNGTLKDEDVFCQICAEKGHRSFECPKRFATNKGGAMAVKCAICGDSSHPTRDCPRKNIPAAAGLPGTEANGGNEQKIDSEYLSFMAELDGKKAEQKPPAGAPNGNGTSVPPPPNMNLPPPPKPSGILPPPPSGVPPPQPPGAAPPGSFTGGQQPPGRPAQSHYQPAQGGGYGNGHYNQQQYAQGHYGHQPPPPQQQQQHYGQQQPPPQQQAPQVKPGEETQGWDPSSYYGGGGGGAAGGFNWWE